MAEKLNITKQEIRTLNRARDVLTAIAERARDYDTTGGGFQAARIVFGRGKVHEVAELAENAIFQTLNTARSYADVESISDDEMHNRKVVKVVNDAVAS